MLKLSTMKKVLATVDGEWKSTLAEEILEPWGFEADSVYYFRASANFIFTFKQQDKKYYLRFNESTERSRELIEDEIKILNFLGTRGVNAARAVKSKSNQFVETKETELGPFYAVVFEEMPGKHLESEDLNETDYKKWGSALGHLHRELSCVPIDQTVNRNSWRESLIFINDQLTAEDLGAIRELELVSEQLGNLRITDTNFGLIHFDFELDNLTFNENSIGILDFDDCIKFWNTGDIVFALRDLDSLSTDHPSFVQFIEGYRSQFDLDEDHINQVEWFQRFHDLFTYARLLRALDVPQTPDQPEWLLNLSKKLHQKIEGYRHSFETIAGS